MVLLSWRDDGSTLSDFRITHKQDQNHSEKLYVSYIHLWMLTGIAGYTKFIQLLFDQWDKGYTLKDNKGLKKPLIKSVIISGIKQKRIKNRQNSTFPDKHALFIFALLKTTNKG